MSEPVKLQNRLKAEFAEAPQRSAGDRFDAAHDIHEIDAEGLARRPEPESHATIRSVIAGVGLLCSALVLATGMATGFYIAAIGLGLAGIAGAAFLFWSRRPLAGAEAAHDRSWERSETSEILSAIHDVLGDIVVMRTLDGRILRANAVLGALTGAADVEGKTC
jgi:PAS domain-containing protein